MHLGQEEGYPYPQIGHSVAVCMGDARDQTMQAQATQVIGGTTAAVVLDLEPECLGHPLADGGVAKSFRDQQEQTEDLQQGDHARVIDAQGRDALLIDDLWLGDLIEHPLGQGAILADGFDFQETAIGSEADGP